MVPKVAGKGRSFKGAGLYYLHDKKANTAERVAFTHTLNLPTENADKAIGWMAHTALRQSEIKAAAGGVAKGRKLRDPVYAYSLSWSPDQQPTKEQMIAAGSETLKRLGLEGHEALFVAHNDEPHPHLHVIVNRVNPENGLAAPLSNDHLKLSEWAEAYERQSGKILCEQRVANNARRKKEFVKDRVSQNPAEFHRWRKQRMEADLARRQQETRDLTRRHDDDRADLAAVLKDTIERRRILLKEEQKPQWAALYRAQRDEKRTFEQAQRTTFGRLRYWLKNRHLDRYGGDSADRQGMLSRAFQIVVNREIMAKALAAKHEAARKALSAQARDRVRDDLSDFYRAHDKMQARMKAEQAAARGAQREKHSRESQEAARRITKGGDRTAFEFGKKAVPEFMNPSLKQTFRDAAGKGAVPAATGRQDAAALPKTPPEKSIEPSSVEQGDAARIIREARKRGLDDSDTGRGDEGGDDEGRGGDDTGGPSGAFRAAHEGKDPLPPQEPAKDAEEGGTAFRAFRDAKERKDKDRDRDDDSGRERTRPPPKPPTRDS